jgi:hypothetical protein
LWFRCDCGNHGWFNPADAIPARRHDLKLAELPPPRTRREERLMAQPLYACRVEDLSPHDRVKVDCWACAKSVGLLTGDFLLRPGLPPYEFVLSIEPRVRCRPCGSRGKAWVTIA